MTIVHVAYTYEYRRGYLWGYRHMLMEFLYRGRFVLMNGLID